MSGEDINNVNSGITATNNSRRNDGDFLKFSCTSITFLAAWDVKFSRSYLKTLTEV